MGTRSVRLGELAFVAMRTARLESGASFRGVSDDIAAARLEACYSCPSCIDSQNLCLECGCNVAMKRWVPWWFCKLGKFGSVK